MHRALILLGLILAGLGARVPDTRSIPDATAHTQELVASDSVTAIPVVRTGTPIIPGLSVDGARPVGSALGRPAIRTRLTPVRDTDSLRTDRSTALAVRSTGWRAYTSADALDRAGRIASRSIPPPASRTV